MTEDAGREDAKIAARACEPLRGQASRAWRSLAALEPDWPVATPVLGFVTGRSGGVSTGSWGLDGDLPGGLNLGARCGDDPAAVVENRRRLAAQLPDTPIWLQQVHGVAVHHARRHGRSTSDSIDHEPVADAAVTDEPGVVLAVLTADCLPVILADLHGRAIGVVHAGWRGLAGGVLENTIAALRGLLPDEAELCAWLGPAIGPDAFEVGDEVRQAFVRNDSGAALGFRPGVRPGKWQADLYALARRRLAIAGVGWVGGGGLCTFADASRFWSYRRRSAGGRMATLVWIDA
jgi:YfiH family protein